ncbi:MAG: hypothetical protein MUF15_00570 [Acidobacteria bacterium]|jgi:hypothetical protein|nr:hypothetical protein [Acidobacteriota bacterium]
MAQRNERLSGYLEPSQYRSVKNYDNLRELYTFFRDKYQDEIDRTFDKISKEIGFVITTTLLIQVGISKDGNITSLSISSEQLKDTIFEREFNVLFKSVKSTGLSKIPEGNYNLYLIWHSALKVKLCTEWMEPAHVPTPGTPNDYITPVNCHIMEPAHWFDSRVSIGQEDAIHISLIDEIHPELRLIDRIISSRESSRRVYPEVMEPAHRGLGESIRPDRFSQFIDEITSLLNRYRS